MPWSERSGPRTPGAKRRKGLVAGASQLLGTSVAAVVPLQRRQPLSVLAASVAEIAALAALVATGSVTALVVLAVLSAVLVAVVATNTRRVLALTNKGNVLLRASVSGWPEGVVGPAPRQLEIPEPAGLGVSLEIAGTTWWVDRSYFRFLRRARRQVQAAEERPVAPPAGGHVRHCNLMARMTVVNEKTTAVTTVIRSRLRSTTVEPAAAEPRPPPNISDRPPPRPLCSRIRTMRVSETMMWIARMTMVNCSYLEYLSPRGHRPGRVSNIAGPSRRAGRASNRQPVR